MRRSKFRSCVALLIAALLAGGCAASLARTPVPLGAINAVQVGHLKDARYWGDSVPKNFDKILKEKIDQTKAHRSHLFKGGRTPTLDFLALSGGGSDGAYGAGFLVGWTKSGKRPEFDIVTGVSTGAMAAPFAFLGPRYDKTLKEIYTRYSTKQLVQPQPLAGLFGGSALVDDSGLKALFAKYVTHRLLAEIAAEHRKGRRLIVATTNLDAERPVIWDMGTIAMRGGKRNLKLFRDVILASAAIPGAFPPVLINVEGNGKTYQELHVDGGTVGQVFFFSDAIYKSSKKRSRLIRAKRRLTVIRNSKLSPEFQSVKPTTLSIATRSISTLMKAQGNGDIFRLYANAKDNGMAFRLAAIPADFKAKRNEAFDIKYMSALFKRGERDARNGYKWLNRPPSRL